MKKSTLPADIVASDLKWPKYEPGKRVVATLTFDEVTSFGWCIRTLGIRRSRRADRTDRTYAVRVSDGSTVRIGIGPHVLRTITVYVTEDRADALAKYTAMHNAGDVRANEIRDRISTRRAQGQLRRAAWDRPWDA